MGKLGQLLVARGWITVQQLTRALKTQSVVGGRLGTCLLEMDALTEELLLKGLAEQLGVPAARVEDLRGIPEEVQELLPAKLARRCRAIPFQAMGGRLDVAMLDARNLGCQDEIAFATGKRLRIHVGNEVRIFEALEKYYDEELPARFGNLLDRLNRSRYLWEKEAPVAPDPARQPPSPLAPLAHDSFARPLRLEPPPHLPELPLPVAPGAASAASAIPPVPPPPAVSPATLPPVAPAREPAPRRPREVAPAGPAPSPAPAAAAAAPKAPVPPATRARTLSLTPQERAAIAGRRDGQPLPPPAGLEEALESLLVVHDREEVGDLLLAFLGARYRRVALFQASRDRVTAWRATGAGVDPEVFGRFTVGFDRPSLFLNLRGGSGLHLGPLPPMPSHRELATAWGGELPRECVMLPVRLKDRLVAIIYADRAESGPAGLHLEELKRLTDATVAAFERCILYKKQAVQGS
jgi:type II secretion system (T2SS) protein E